jgi:HEAT repeat protein
MEARAGHPLRVGEAEEWEVVREALRAEGVDPTDLARFVNRSHAGLPGFAPERFDVHAAYPVLLRMLQRVKSPAVTETLARRIAQAGKSSNSAQALLAVYRSRPDWAVGDAIARTMTPADHHAVVELAADDRAGVERQMLVYALWRVKSARAREVILELLDDPAVCKHAMYSLRRAFGNEEAERRLNPLENHADDQVRTAAREALKRIARARA